jgi:predicted nucleotidyltransferase
MLNLESIKLQRSNIYAKAEKCGISNIRIFGSVARGDAHEGSDLDLLVDVKPGSGIGFIRFAHEIEDMFHCKVDLITDTSIKEILRENILNEAVPL